MNIPTSTQVDIIAWPPRFIFTPTLQNFKRVFVEQNFLLYLKNSVVVAFGAVMFSLLLGLPAAYSIARFHQTKLSVLILVARLLPGISFLMPWYVVFSRLHLMDSYIALILSHMLIALPLMGTLLLINICMGILARAAPQMNLLSEGFALLLLTSFFVITALMPQLCDFFERSFNAGITSLIALFSGGAS